MVHQSDGILLLRSAEYRGSHADTKLLTKWMKSNIKMAHASSIITIIIKKYDSVDRNSEENSHSHGGCQVTSPFPCPSKNNSATLPLIIHHGQK
jgi:hypothetical protein